MVGDADVDILDGRMREVGPCDDNIKDTAEIMRWLIDMLQQVERRHQFSELLTRCVIWSVETDVYVTGEDNRLVDRCSRILVSSVKNCGETACDPGR